MKKFIILIFAALLILSPLAANVVLKSQLNPRTGHQELTVKGLGKISIDSEGNLYNARGRKIAQVPLA